MGENSLQAVVFDLDGVITDTARYHYLAWKELADQLGIHIDRTFNEKLKGVSRLDSLELILKEGNQQNKFSESEKVTLAAKKNNMYCSYLKKINPKDILPGIEKLIHDIKKDGILIGLASVSKNAPTVLQALQLENVFDYCVDAHFVKKSKPDPEIFLKACCGLKSKPEKSIGIEDSIAGIVSIKAGGLFAVGVGKGLNKADYCVANTSQLSWTGIKDAFNLDKGH